MDFFNRETHKQFQPGCLHWNVYLVKDYQGTSVLYFRYHHYLADGVGGAVLACALQEQYNPKQLPFIRDLTPMDIFVKKASMILAPYQMILETIKLMSSNCSGISIFNSKDKVSANHNLYESKGYRVEDLKRVSKRYNGTINDLLCTVFSTSLRAYLDKHEEPSNIPKEGCMVVPVNIRPTPRTLLEMRKGHNANHGELICMPLSGDFKSTFTRIQEQINDFKRSNKHFMLSGISTLGALFFPTIFKDSQMDSIYESLRVNITNICGGEEPLKFGDALSKEIVFHSYAEDHHFNTMQMCIFSHRGTLKMNLSSSKMKADSREIIRIMEE